MEVVVIVLKILLEKDVNERFNNVIPDNDGGIKNKHKNLDKKCHTSYVCSGTPFKKDDWNPCV